MSKDTFTSTTRREFLGAATAGAVGATLALPAIAGTQMDVAINTPEKPIKLAQANAASKSKPSTALTGDWSKPAGMAIPKEGYFKLEKGRYGPIFPKTPANYGFTIIAKVKPGREETIRNYGKTVEGLIADKPDVLAVLKLHYLRWVLFDIGNGLHFMYQGIFDTDFDKYTEDAVALFTTTGVNTIFENLEGFPTDWKTNVPAFIKFMHEHQRPSFLEYGEYPYVSADEIKKALKVRRALSTMLDLAQ